MHQVRALLLVHSELSCAEIASTFKSSLHWDETPSLDALAGYLQNMVKAGMIEIAPSVTDDEPRYKRKGAPHPLPPPLLGPLTIEEVRAQFRSGSPREG